MSVNDLSLYSFSNMALSKGFNKSFFAGDSINTTTPILLVESQTRNRAWNLTDGDTSGEFVFKEGSGPYEGVVAGARLILHEFHLCGSSKQPRRKHIGIIQRFDVYKLETLVTSAICLPTSSTYTRSTSTQTPPFPSLIPEAIVPGRICKQMSWTIARIGSYFERFFRNEAHHRPPVASTVSAIVGLNLSTVYSHLKRQTNPANEVPKRCHSPKNKLLKREMWAKVASKYEPFIQDKIRRTIYQNYRNQIPLNLPDLIEEISSQLNDGPEKIMFKPSLTQMRQILKGMGFRYEKIRGRTQIYESKELGVKRRKYLRKIRQLREIGAELIWMDETWIWAGMKKEYEWIDQNMKKDPITAYQKYGTSGPKPGVTHGSRAIVIGAMSQNGIVTESCVIFRGGMMEDGDYHRQMDSAIFEQWLQENIPHFVARANGRKVAIIMDNAPYHSRRLNKLPTKSSTKKDMIKFLEECGIQNIPFGLRREEFFEVLKKFVEENPQFNERFAAEEICKEFDVEIVRLPPYHCLLNPIEMIWNQMKQKVRAKSKTSTKIAAIMMMGKDALEEIAEESVKNCVKHVEEIEKWFWEAEGMREEIAPFVIPIEDDDSEWDEESDEELEMNFGEEICVDNEVEIENDENIDPSPSSSQIPPSPNPCPTKKQKYLLFGEF